LTRRCIQVEELRCGIGEHQDMFVLKCQIFTAYMQSGFKLQQSWSRLAYGEQSDHSEDPQQWNVNNHFGWRRLWCYHTNEVKQWDDCDEIQPEPAI
jgi:hypothetical protein